MRTSAENARPMRRARVLHKVPPELEVHFMIADLLRFSLKPGWIWWHTPNGDFRNKATAGRLKRMGVLPGVSDFLLLSPDGDLHALELKREGKRPTPEQIAFLSAVFKAGGTADWCDNFDDAVEIFKLWNCVRLS